MKRHALLASLLLALPLWLSCELFEKPDDSGDGDADSDSDSDTDSDADGDSDTDLDCDDPPAAAGLDGPDCVTTSIGCNDSLVGTTEGGTDVMDGESYQNWYCTPSTASEYGGLERVYEFQHPGKGNVEITLETPCADLDLVAIYWESDECPLPEYSILECDAKVGTDSTHSLTIWNNEPRRYLVVVDGIAGAEVPFRLSTSCP